MKKDLKNKLLSKEQADAVKTMIVDSMRSVYLDVGNNPPPAFYTTSENIADRIIDNVQKSLLLTSTFEKAVNKKKPLKTKKSK